MGPLEEAGVGGEARPGVALLQHGPDPEGPAQAHLPALEAKQRRGKPAVEVLPEEAHPGPGFTSPEAKAQGKGVFPLVVELGEGLLEEGVEEPPQAQGLKDSL
jgi:hypothetical protein